MTTNNQTQSGGMTGNVSEEKENQVCQIKFSRQAIPAEIIIENETQKNEILGWVENHRYVRWVDWVRGAQYGEPYTFEQWKAEYME